MTDEIAPQSLSTPGFFPRGMVPDWVTFHPDLSERALAVAAVIQAFASPNGSMPTFGRQRLADRFGCSIASLDRRTRELVEIGFLAKVPTYIDADTGERTTDEHAASGAANAQTSNTWVVREAPPMGDEHPHPISSSEFCHPEKIRERIAARRKLAAAMDEAQGSGSRGGLTREAGVRPAETPKKRSSTPPRTPEAPPNAHVRPKQDPVEQDPNQPTREREAAAAVAAGSDGWLAAPQKKNNTADSDADSAGAELLRSLAAADGSTLAAHAIAEHADLVDELLNAGHSERAIRRHLTDGGRTAGFIVSKLRKLAAGEERLPAPATSRGDSSQLPACATCKAREGEARHTRTVLTDPRDAESPEVPCPDCRGDADRAA